MTEYNLKPLWLVDGYNVIFADPVYWRFEKDDLEHAREFLADTLLDLAKHTGIEVVLVFDGKKIGHDSKIIERAPGFHIVYTTAKTTADSYIEKAAFRQRDNYRYIYVVTSDGPEQSQVSGSGAYRKSVRDLMHDIRADKKAQKEEHSNFTQKQRVALVEQLCPDARDFLERLRRRK